MPDIKKKTAVTETIPDRIVRYFNPAKAVERLRARHFLALNESFFASSRTRPGTKNLVANSYDADSAMRYEIVEARNRSSHVIRNIPLAVGAIGTTVTNVVGSGLVMQSRIDRRVLGLPKPEAKAWQKDVEFKYRLHMESKESDLSRTLSGYERQDLVFRSALEKGDIIAIRREGETRGYPYRLRTQLVEAERICNEGDAQDTEFLSYGFRRDANGAPVEVHILRTHPGSTIGRGKKEWDKVLIFGTNSGRRQVLHVSRPLRPGQTRGLPFLTPVIESLIQLGKYTEAEIHAAVVAGMFTVFVKTADGEGGGGMAGTPSTNTTTDSSKDEQKLGYGSVVDLNKDESIEIANPTRPNGNFDPFVLSFCRWIGVALEIPYEILIKHFTASYSASRAALQEAWKFFKGRREWLAANYCQPEYEWWMDEVVSRGIVAAPGYFEDPFIRQAYLGAVWIGPSKGMIQENIEVEAALKRIEGGLSTIAEETAALTGGDFETNHEQHVDEMEMRKTDGLLVPMVAPADQKPAAAQPGKENDGPDTEGIDKSDDDAAEPDYSVLQMKSNTYGIAVRSGAITPQPEDETQFRADMGLPEQSEAVKNAWKKDGSIRRPITLQSGTAVRAEEQQISGTPEEE
jgi:lambda family phage portal protein